MTPKPRITVKALVASLALAAASSQALAAIRTPGHGGLLLPLPGDLVQMALDFSAPGDPVARASDFADGSQGLSPLAVDVAMLGGGNAFSPRLKEQSTRVSDLAGIPNGGGQVAGPASQTSFPKGGTSTGGTFGLASASPSVAANAAVVPEPGNWATLLAGLLGVGAIARRRMQPR